MKHTPSRFAYVTRLLWVVLLLPGFAEANLANYCRNDKGISLQLEIVLSTWDTLPAKEEENFDTPFGGSDYTPHNPDPFSQQEATPSKIMPTLKIAVDTSFSQVHKIPKEYSGFKIEIKSTPEPLPSSHDIFFQHGKLVVDRLQNGTYSYLLGNFQTADEASVFLQDFLIKRYANARVVEYESGKRLY